MLNAEPYQTQLENSQEMFVPRSVAASYLLGLPIRRYQYQYVNSPIDTSQLLMPSEPTNEQQQQQQRTKRIYWENLAFHASDFNQKAKKV